jgi:hypothetical protein
MRDEIRDIRLRVLEQDQSVIVARAAGAGRRCGRAGRRSGVVGADRQAFGASGRLEVPGYGGGRARFSRARCQGWRSLRHRARGGEDPAGDGLVETEADLGTAADWLPGIP